MVVSLFYHHGTTWSSLGLHHFWLNKGSGTSRKIHPIHSIVRDIGLDVIKYLPAAHALTGADTTSKVGTKHSLMSKTDKFELLEGFGMSELTEEMFQRVEEFLVKCISNSKSTIVCKNFDELRITAYNTYSNGLDLQKMPCTSAALREHIKRSYLQANMWISATLPTREILNHVELYAWNCSESGRFFFLW